MASATHIRQIPNRRTCRDDMPARFADLGLPWVPCRELVPHALPVPGLARDIRVKIAATRPEWHEAFQLVADNYQARGYDGPDAADYRFTAYHALPDTVTFVATVQGRVVLTMALVPDNTLLGLPLESIYRAEVQQLRQAGHRLGEVTSLAAAELSLREFTKVFVALIRLMKQYHRAAGGDTWVIAVNPRHSGYYTRLLGYTPLGPRRSYAAVRGHPAEAYYLTVPLLKVKAPRMHRELFDTPLAGPALAAPRMPAALVRSFGNQSSQTDPRHVEEILRYVDDCGSPRRW